MAKKKNKKVTEEKVEQVTETVEQPVADEVTEQPQQEETVKEEAEYPNSVLYEGLTEEGTTQLKNLISLLSYTYQKGHIEEYNKYYLGGLKYMLILSSSLPQDEREKFWTHFDIIQFVQEINYIEVLSKLLSPFTPILFSDVEALHLITKNVFKRFKNRSDGGN